MISLKRNNTGSLIPATGLRNRETSIYRPNQTEDFRVSRSKFSDFMTCRRCFYLDRVKGLDEPGMPGWALNSATDELLKIDNRSAQAWYIKTICVDSTGDRKSALDLIDKAVALQPNNLRYLEAKYKLTASIGDQTGATVVLEKMKSINPKLPNLVELQALLEVPATK